MRSMPSLSCDKRCRMILLCSSTAPSSESWYSVVSSSSSSWLICPATNRAHSVQHQPESENNMGRNRYSTVSSINQSQKITRAGIATAHSHSRSESAKVRKQYRKNSPQKKKKKREKNPHRTHPQWSVMASNGQSESITVRK